MRHQRDARGSVLLLVVGLLTIIGLLGSMFLLASYMDSRQSEALADKRQSDPIVWGVMAQILARLEDDQFVNDSGPYGAADATSNPAPWGGKWTPSRVWQAWIDGPRQVVDPNDPAVRWLSDSFLTYIPSDLQVGQVDYQRLCDVSGQLGKYANGIRFVRTWNSTTSRWVWRTDWRDEGGVYVEIKRTPADTDGDGWPDALLVDTGLSNDKGLKYHYAVQITDLSGMLCANTGGWYYDESGKGTYAFTTPICPVNVDLRAFLGNTIYDELHKVRCNGADKNLDPFNQNVALRLMNPDPNHTYLPFSIGEEVFLRFRAPSPLVETGRLWGVMNDGDPNRMAQRRLMTTYNTFRSIVRHPEPDPNEPLNDFTTRLSLKIPTPPDPNQLQKIYRRMEKLLSLSGAAEPEKMAAAYVANLWAYQAEDDSDAPWRFVPRKLDGSGDEAFAAYGMRDLGIAITEAYAKGKYEGKLIEVQAIELMNYTAQPINLGTERYKLQVKGNPTPIDLAQVVPAGGKVVVLAKTGDPDDAFFSLDSGVIAEPVSGKGLDLTKDILLVKVVKGDPVPVDYVEAFKTSDYEHPSSPGQFPKYEILRDDRLSDWRFLVGDAFAEDKNYDSHKLGKDNGLAWDQSVIASKAKYAVKVSMKGGELESLGEMGRIFLCGPFRDESGVLRPFTRLIWDWPFDDRPERGRLEFHPASVNSSGYDNGNYPDVPPALLINELFSLIRPDDTRGDVQTRVYGRINVNTAPEEVLRRLPWPRTAAGYQIRDNPDNPTQDEVGAIVALILAYREGSARTIRLDRQREDGSSGGSVTIMRTYSDRSAARGSGIDNLRSSSQCQGFLTAGELAIPLADFVNSLLGWTMYTPDPRGIGIREDADYLEGRDSLFTAVSNLVTVNSDAFAANIVVQLGEDPARPKYVWRYVAVFDRSCRQKSSYRPAVLLLSQVR